METKNLSPVITQLVERKLGMYASSHLGNDIYFLIEAINTLISAVGIKEVKNEWVNRGNKLEDFEIKIKLLTKLSSQVKIFYDAIQDKSFSKKENNKVEAMLKKYFFKSASKIVVLQRDLYDMFIMLIEMTSIKNKTITSDAFKILEHSGTGKFDMTKRQHPIRDMSNEFK